MSERKVTVTLGEREIQLVEQAVLDKDAESALEFVRKVVKPRIDQVVNRPHCKPVFEWGRAESLVPPARPMRPEGSAEDGAHLPM